MSLIKAVPRYKLALCAILAIAAVFLVIGRGPIAILTLCIGWTGGVIVRDIIFHIQERKETTMSLDL